MTTAPSACSGSSPSLAQLYPPIEPFKSGVLDVGDGYANRDEARRGLNGVFEDIKHIALYAAYCDAFLMDQPMAELVRQPTVSLEQRYGVKVFSLNNQD